MFNIKPKCPKCGKRDMVSEDFSEERQRVLRYFCQRCQKWFKK
ncbi:iSH4-type transposase domain protein [Streptomyces phage BRock]|uniref:ISH4-type transposase domain protein n=1 Tax=Streptomyces phage BRock TaxID=1913591 RepID=A0A1J0GVW8_9CAUD|nr:iSH4-type transposase domain protein [Streptomyces phage BRock]APC46318.1 iSH4-type transposase domain protein [Streptomyces phage BRock]